MKTRFDNNKYWVTTFGEAVEIKDMSTAHLMNTARMLVQKPDRVLSMLVVDIENSFATPQVWSPLAAEDDREQSLHNATSMSPKALTEYVTGTPLFKAIVKELEARGVNVENVLTNFTGDSK